MLDMDKYFLYLVLAFAVLLPLNIMKYVRREVFVQKLLRRNHNDKNKILKSSSYIFRIIRFLLWMSLICILLVPPICTAYLGMNFWITFSFYGLQSGWLYNEYRFQIWLKQYLDRQLIDAK